jgi:hypothetical protein
MKRIQFIAGIILASSIAFTSCKKDYTCTCTKDIGGISSTTAHDLQNQNLKDATEACDRFETDANNGGIGTTNCHL